MTRRWTVVLWAGVLLVLSGCGGGTETASTSTSGSGVAPGVMQPPTGGMPPAGGMGPPAGGAGMAPPGMAPPGMAPPTGGAPPGMMTPPGAGMTPPGAGSTPPGMTTPPGAGAGMMPPGMMTPPGSTPPGMTTPPGAGAGMMPPGMMTPPGAGATPPGITTPPGAGAGMVPPGMTPPGAPGQVAFAPGSTPMPGIPGAPGAPTGVPETPGFPGAPGAPTPGFPGAPGAPMGVPGTPGFPGAPGAPTPGFPGAPGVPGVPGVPGAEGSPGATAKQPETAAEFAAIAFQAGKNREGFQLLNLDAIVGGETLKQVEWYPGLRRPAAGVHFGIGIDYSGTRAVASPEAIGGSGAGAGAAGGMAGPGMMPPGMAPPGGGQGGRGRTGRNNRNTPGVPGQPGGQQREKPDLFKAPEEPSAQLAFFAGELGSKLVSGIESRVKKGAFGKPLETASKAPAVAAGAAAGFAGAPGFPGAPGGPPMGMVPPGGAPGGFPPGMAPPGGAFPGMMPGAPGAGGAGVGAKGNQLAIGLTMVGEGSQRELIDRAKKEGVDILFIVAVEVRAAGDTVINKTKINVYSMAKKEVAFGGNTLTNTTVEKAREEKRGEDPVDAEMNRLFAFVDEQYQAQALPETATADKLDKYVAKLAEAKVEDPLPTLVELRFYYDRKLITTERLTQIAQAVAGGEAGSAVGAGNVELILTALEKWLPPDLPKSLVAGGGGAGEGGATGGAAGAAAGLLQKLLGGGNK